jgi:multiple sugar transport system permease protein
LLASLVLLFFVLLFLMPFLWMLTTSFKTESQVYSFPPRLIPAPFSIENFIASLKLIDLAILVRNSTIIALAVTLGTMLTSAFVGYAFAMLPARGKSALMLVMVSTIVIPPTIILVPQFILLSHLGWVDTYLPLILPPIFGNVIYILLFRQFFRSLPGELMESAELDGCSPIMSFIYIALPIARPLLTVVGVFAFIGAWNEFLSPLVYLNNQQDFTVSLGLSTFESVNYNQLHLMMPVSLLAILPVVLLFFASQENIEINIFGRLDL